MSPNDSHHDHDHDHDHDHEHEHDEQAPSGPPIASDEYAETASRSLSNALRLSFVLLSGIMVLVLAAYLLSGFKSVGTNEVGIKKIFGKFQGVAEPGLAYTWPYPIGQIEIVSTNAEPQIIEDFWIFELPADKGKPLSERKVTDAGLRTGWDGALLTGDRNLVHVLIECWSAVGNARDFRANVPDPYVESDPVTGKDRRIQPRQKLVNAAVCSAAIRVAGATTAESLLQQRAQFTSEVTIQAQKQLDQLGTGLRITSLAVKDYTWPLAARGAYEAAQQASKEADKAVQEARNSAISMLNNVAGPDYGLLVGDPLGTSPERFATEPDAPAAPATNVSADARAKARDLIGQYEWASNQASAALARGDKPLAAKWSATAGNRMAEIDRFLESNMLQGNAAKVIQDARGSGTEFLRVAEARAQRLRELKPQYDKNPTFMLHRWWSDAADAILAIPTVEIYRLKLGDTPTTILIGPDAGVTKAINEAGLRKDITAKP